MVVRSLTTSVLGTEEDASRAMALLEHDATRKDITQDALLIETPYLEDSAIMSLATKYEPSQAELKIKPLLHKVTLYNRAVESCALVRILPHSACQFDLTLFCRSRKPMN